MFNSTGSTTTSNNGVCNSMLALRPLRTSISVLPKTLVYSKVKLPLSKTTKIE